MKIIRYTSYGTIEKIKENGLIASKKRNSTKKINICLESFKPGNLPSFIDLNNCLYFLPSKSSYTPFKLGKGIEALGCLQVDTKDLDINKLYVANGMYAGRVEDLLKKAFRSKDVETALNNALNTQYYKDTCNKFWKSFKPYKLHRAMNRSEDDEIIEYLYFDDIEPEHIKEIEFDKSFFI